MFIRASPFVFCNTPSVPPHSSTLFPFFIFHRCHFLFVRLLNLILLPSRSLAPPTLPSSDLCSLVSSLSSLGHLLTSLHFCFFFSHLFLFPAVNSTYSLSLFFLVCHRVFFFFLELFFVPSVSRVCLLSVCSLFIRE